MKIKLKFFKKEHNFKKKDFTLNPNFYWEIALCLTFAMILLSGWFGYHLFTQINQEIVLPVANSNGQILTINQDRVKKVLDYFSEREKKSAEIINSPASVVDPSL